MGLSISTTPAKIAIETVPAELEMHVKNAELRLKQKQPKMNIETEPLVVMIDQYQCFAEAGLKNISDFAREQGQKGLQSVTAYTGKIASDGDAMARIGYRANIMINIAKNSAIKKRDFNVDFIPKSRPKITVTGGTVDLKAEFINNIGEINGVTGQYIPADIRFKYKPPNVDIRVVSYGSVDIKYTGNSIDGYI